jgi:G:T-mismatch repair DNA endonuclease (very short patch repair protein)
MMSQDFINKARWTGWAAEEEAAYHVVAEFSCPICGKKLRSRSGLLHHLGVASDKFHKAFVLAQQQLALECWSAGLTCREAAASQGMWFGYDWISRFWRATFGENQVDVRYRDRLAKSVKQAHKRMPDFNGFSRVRKSPGFGTANPFFGKSHSEEAREKISQAHKGKVISDEQKRKFHEAHRRRFPTKEAYAEAIRARYEANPEAKEKLRAARLKQRFPRRSTRPERLLGALLDELGVEVFEQLPMPPVGVVDFLVGSLVLEVYGDYWHANPEVYGPTGHPLNLHQVNQRIKDAARNQHYESLGYQVEIFWESELIRNIEAVRKRLVALIEEKIR